MTGQHDEPTSSARNRQPLIGVFDSGVGGLSVVLALRRLAPAAAVCYLADAAWAPYGPRPAAELRERSTRIAAKLRHRGADALVIACNTATAAAAEHLRADCPLPIIGMEPAIKPAVRATRTGTVAVLATRGTLASQRFAGLLARHTGDTRVLVEPCGDLVAYAESGDWHSDAVATAAARHIDNVIAAGADTVVVGCTHFPLLHAPLEAAAAGRLHFIDTGEAVARQILARTGMPTEPCEQPSPMTLLTTGNADHIARIAGRLFETTPPAEPVSIDDDAPGDRHHRPTGSA